MKKLQISIREVDNGYIVYEDHVDRGFSGRQWVAVSVSQLKDIVEARAAECLSENDGIDRSKNT